MNQPDVQLLYSRSSDPNDSADIDVLVTVTVPLSRARRPPINLALVLDRSGSMAGSALQLAKRAAQQAVRQLGPQDRISVVIFDSHAEVLVPSTPGTETETIVQAIGQVAPGGSTALYEGWLTGTKQVQVSSQGYALNRVLVLTDGFANIGLREPDALASEVARALTAGVSTSVIGLGSDYHEVLLEALATAGDGNYSYVEHAQELEAVFVAELAGLQATAGQRVSLELSGEPGVTVQEVYNDLPQLHSGRLRLPNLLLGRPVEVAARLNLRPSETTEATLRLRLAWDDVVSGQRQVYRRQVILPQPASLPHLPAVASVVMAMRVARSKDQAIRATECGDRVGARQHWNTAAGLISAGIGDGLLSDREALDLRQVLDRLDRGDQASASKLTRSQNYARRHSKQTPKA